MCRTGINLVLQHASLTYWTTLQFVLSAQIVLMPHRCFNIYPELYSSATICNILSLGVSCKFYPREQPWMQSSKGPQSGSNSVNFITVK